MNFLDLIWLIPLIPLGGAVLMLLFGKLLDPLHIQRAIRLGQHAGAYFDNHRMSGRSHLLA